MDQNQIKVLREQFLSEIETESKTTERVLAAASTGNAGYKPDPSSKTALELAWHIASADWWFADSICKGDFSGSDDGKMPPEVKTIADVCTWYKKNFPATLERVRALSPEALSKPVSFFNIATLPALMYLGWLRSHSIHHRGQLSTYLRAMGSKVPQIYGGSYDQPMKG